MKRTDILFMENVQLRFVARTRVLNIVDYALICPVNLYMRILILIKNMVIIRPERE